MTQRTILAWLTIGLAALLSACHDGKADTPQPEKARRTVLVYMAGENDLSVNVTSDLDEMKQASRQLGDDDRLVVFVDRANSAELPYIARVQNGEEQVVHRFSEDFYSSDPERLTSIVGMVDSLFPAETYGLILWGHATGWVVVSDSVPQSAGAPLTRQTAHAPRHAYGKDTGSNTTTSFQSRWMNITQMRRALQPLSRRLFIMADCCCMMSAEVAYELREQCRYLIGSPAEVPADGAPYHLVVPHLFSQKTDFYRDIVDAYYDYYLQRLGSEDPTLSGHSLPLSVVDMDQMESLAQATSTIVMPRSRISTDSLAYYFRIDMPVMHDMGNYAYTHILPADKARYTAWRQALDRAVVYRRFSARWTTAYVRLMYDFDTFATFTEDSYAGLSMFLPRPEYSFSSVYDYNGGFRQLQWYDAAGCASFIDF